MWVDSCIQIFIMSEVLYKVKTQERGRERGNTAGCITVRPELTRSEQRRVTGGELDCSYPVTRQPSD